jgi:hypothetical protein
MSLANETAKRTTRSAQRPNSANVPTNAAVHSLLSVEHCGGPLSVGDGVAVEDVAVVGVGVGGRVSPREGVSLRMAIAFRSQSVFDALLRYCAAILR